MGRFWHRVAPLLLLGACGGDRRTPVEPGYVVRDATAPRSASKLPLVPRPRFVETCTGVFGIDATTTLVAPREAMPVRARLEGWLGLSPMRLARGTSRGIVLQVDPTIQDDEAYMLDVTPERAVIRGRSLPGLFYGAQTLAILAGSRPIGDAPPAPLPRSVPCVHVEDAPRVRFRGMHLDVARHFFSKEIVERYVDLLALYRFNVFHWHLSDDQGFRLALRSHPELAAPDAGGRDGAYSAADVREVVAYAAARGIDVLPEIETPGHARGILASHPELSCVGKPLELPRTWGIFDDVLCAGNPDTYKLLDDVFGEVALIFPYRFVHVGGDEVPRERWSACPKCRALMREEGTDAEGLAAVFLARVERSLTAHGRRAMVWDDALDAGKLPEGTVVVAWRGLDRGVAASRAGYDVVMAPSDTVYFDAHQSRAGGEPGREGYIPWTKVLSFDPLPPGADVTHVLGGEGTLWTEHVKTEADIDTLLEPRVAALAEALWSGPGEPSDFGSRFAAERPLLDASGIRYFVEPPVGLPRKKVFLDTARVAAHPSALFADGTVRFTTDGSDPTRTSPALVWMDVSVTTNLAARLFLANGRTSPVVHARFEKQSLRPAVVVPSPQLGVKYTYFEGDYHAVPDFGAERPVRSGKLAQIALAPDFRAERFAVLFEGYVDVKTDGVHRFVARADDGVFLDVDGERVLADDGEHAARDADGEMALAHGLHRIRVGYFQGTGGKSLALSCDDAPCVLLADP
jgi:hexosaminidase